MSESIPDYLWDKNGNFIGDEEFQANDSSDDRGIYHPTGPCLARSVDTMFSQYKNQRKAVIVFESLESGYEGTRLNMYCNCPEGPLKPGMKLHDQLMLALGRRPKMIGEISLAPFKGIKCVIAVRKSKTKYPGGCVKPEQIQKPVVDGILEVLDE